MQDMIDFCTARSCRRAYLLEYFGEPEVPKRCGACDICIPENGADASPVMDEEFEDGPGSAKPGLDSQLLSSLRRLRKEIADRERIPPYLVFSDAVLREMATGYPQDLRDLNRIEGVAHAKLRKYGPPFVEEIVSWCAANAIDPYALPEAPAGPMRLKASSDRSSNQGRTWSKDDERRLSSGYRAGRSIGELARLLERKPGAIQLRLMKLGLIEGME
jgi:ATP-dependent DNA helicase RecQ